MADEPDRFDPQVLVLRLVVQGLLKQLRFEGVLTGEKVKGLKDFVLEASAHLKVAATEEDRRAGLQVESEIIAFFDAIGCE